MGSGSQVLNYMRLGHLEHRLQFTLSTPICLLQPLYTYCSLYGLLVQPTNYLITPIVLPIRNPTVSRKAV